MWHFLYAVESSDVVKGIDTWGKTSVEAENLVVNERSERKIVEEICKELPYVRIAVFSKTFVVEAIDLGNLAGLVITTKDCDTLWISDFESNEEGNSFYRVVASIDIISCNGEFSPALNLPWKYVPMKR